MFRLGVQSAAAYGLLIAFSALAIFPLVGVALAAMHPPGGFVEGFSLPTQISLDTFAYAWEQGGFGTSMWASVIVAMTVVALATVCSVLAGYAFGTMDFPGRDLLFYAILVGLMVPLEVLIVPLYFDLRQSLPVVSDSYLAVILPEAAISLAFGTYWMRSFFRKVSPALIEAGRVDGANSWQILWYILLPISRTSILAMVVLIFLSSWNAYLVPLVMTASNPELQTVPLGLARFASQYERDVPGQAAAALIVAVPAVTVFVLLQRQFIGGLTAGALKG